MSTSVDRFNIRVYGIWLNERREVLLTDELIKGQHITKYPGGGLELGEGILNALYREWAEEVGVPIVRYRHLYTTDFFQQSAWAPSDQIIAVYYLLSCEGDAPKVAPSGEIQGYRWQSLQTMNTFHLTLPIDRHVTSLLLDNPHITI